MKIDKQVSSKIKWSKKKKKASERRLSIENILQQRKKKLKTER